MGINDQMVFDRRIPTLVGSGVTPENMVTFATADAFIVGSSVKEDGLWSNRLDDARLAGAGTRILRRFK